MTRGSEYAPIHSRDGAALASRPPWHGVPLTFWRTAAHTIGSPLVEHEWQTQMISTEALSISSDDLAFVRRDVAALLADPGLVAAEPPMPLIQRRVWLEARVDLKQGEERMALYRDLGVSVFCDGVDAQLNRDVASVAQACRALDSMGSDAVNSTLLLKSFLERLAKETRLPVNHLRRLAKTGGTAR